MSQDTIGRSEPILQGLGGFVLTKSNTVNLVDDAGNTKGYKDDAYSIYVGGSGNIEVVTADGSVVLFSGVGAGVFLPMLITRVNSTNTTATLMVAIKGN